MDIREHIPLKELTTLKIGGTARYFAAVESSEALREAVSFAREKSIPFAILGGGSNVLISGGEFQGLVIQIGIRGVEWESPLEKGEKRMRGASQDLEHSSSDAKGVQPRYEGPESARGRVVTTHASGTPFAKGDVLVVAGAGENWDALVSEAVKRGLWGIENLSGIPGTVGAAPIQNIGAYGTEIKETVKWVEVFDTRTGTFKQLSNADCRFAYRDSIFKKPEGRSFIVTRVALRLKKSGVPNLEYKDLKNYFFGETHSSFPKGGGESASRRVLNPSPPSAVLPLRKGELLTLAAIRAAVLLIRSKKFPDLNQFGTAGSFFKNPIVSKEKFDELKKKYPDLPGFLISCSPFPKGSTPSSEEGFKSSGLPVRRLAGGEDSATSFKKGGIEERVKIPLAWVFDNICGLKGFEKGNVRLFEKQPIVLVQNGSASSEEIESFAKEIAENVKEKTGIDVEWEVQSIK